MTALCVLRVDNSFSSVFQLTSFVSPVFYHCGSFFLPSTIPDTPSPPHRIDAWSPLLPPPTSTARAPGEGPSNTYRFPETLQRAAEYDAGGRDERARGVFPHEERPSLRAGSKFADGGSPRAPTAEELVRFWDDCRLEVLCLVEGIDVSTSATIQARHSYTRMDLAFDMDFATCVSEDPRSGACTIDFHKFHELVPVPHEEDNVEREPAAPVSHS